MPIIIVIAILWAALIPTARADPGDPTLPTVVVVATTPLAGAELDRNRIAAPVQTATAEDLDRSHAVDLTAYMNRAMGGVYVNDVQNNPLQPDVNYRGYTASPLLGTPQGLSVYLDGVRLNQPFGDVVSWDLIPRAAISSMTLMPGSNPLFGLNTLGGALALRTKDGFSNPGTSAQLSYGSDQRRSVELETGGNTGQGLYWYATGNKLKDDGWRDDSPTDATQAFGKFGWRSEATDVALTAAYADTDLTGNGLQEQRLLERDYDSVYTKPDNTQNRSQLVNLTARHSVAANITLSGNAYYRNIRTSTFNGDLNDDDESEEFNGLLNCGRISQHDGGLSGQISVNTQLGGRAQQFTAGVALIDSTSHFTQSSELGFLTEDRGVVGAGEEEDDAAVDLTGDTRTRSVYLSETLQLPGSMQLTLSGRYDHTSVETRDALIPGGEPGSLDGDHTFSRFNPAAGLTISPTQNFTGYLGYVEGSRAPSAIELGCADPENPCKLPNAMAGDPPLDQVITKTVEAGVRGRLGGAFEWNAGVFSAMNHDDIMFVADDTAGFGYFRNFGKTRRQGAELGLSGTLGALHVGAHYTYLDATYRSEEEVNGEANSSGVDEIIEIEPGDRIPLTPRHVFKSFVEWRVAPSLTLDADMITIAGSYARGNENNQHEPDGVDFLGPGRTGGYTVVNLGADYSATPNLEVFAQVNNLFDREYFTASQLGATGFDDEGNVVSGAPRQNATFYAPGAPRAYWVGVKYSFGR